MFSAVAAMAGMFGPTRNEETQTEVLKDIYGDLQKIKKSFEITIVPASEEREKEFDKEKRHQELLAAFKRAGLALRRSASDRDGDEDKDKDKKGNWLTRLATTYFSYRVLKGFIRRFFKIMRLGRLWTLLRGLGFLLTRLFWPLAVAGALIWAIPKIIENWPAILQTVKDTVNGIWNTIKGWLSFLGVDFEEEEEDIAPGPNTGPPSQMVTEQESIGNDFTPRWVESSPGKGSWMVNGTALPGLGINDGKKAASIAATMRTSNSIMGDNVRTEDVVPQQNIMGDDVTAISGVVAASGFQHDDSGITDTPDIVQPQDTFTPFQSAAAERGRGGQTNENEMTRGNYNIANYQKQAAMNWERDYGMMGDNSVFRSAPTAQDNLDDLGVTGTWTPLYPKGHERYSEDKGSWKVRQSDMKGKQNANWARINKEKPLTADMLAKERGRNRTAQIRQQESDDKRKKFWADQRAAQEARMQTVPGKLNPKVTVVENEPVVTDSSVTQTSANASRATNKDYSTGNPFMGLYA